MPHFKGFAMMNDYCFCSHIQSLVELESVIVATAPYFEHTAPLTYSLWFWGWPYTFKNIKMQGFDEDAQKREKKNKPKIRKQFLSERKDGKKVQ